MNKNITDIMSKDEFEEIITTETLPIVVDFWATWCTPCRMQSPIIDEFADEFAEKVRVLKVDTDANEELSYSLGIRSIPTLMVYKNGKMQEKTAGLTTKAQLSELVLKHI